MSFGSDDSIAKGVNVILALMLYNSILRPILLLMVCVLIEKPVPEPCTKTI
jgi:hypothetical protein